MASPVATFMTTVKTAWEETAPPTGDATPAYEFIDDFIEERGGGQHREIYWGDPDGAGFGGSVSMHETTIEAVLVVGRNNRTMEAFRRAIREELVTLTKATSALSTFGSGVVGAHIESGPHIEHDETGIQPRAGGGRSKTQVARVVFPFRVLTQEV